MAAKPGLIPAALMSSVMVPIVTLLDLGWRAGVLGRRVRARFLPRPIAAIAACLILPLARRLPERNVALIDGRY
jgi:hypothetical protein